MTSPRLPATVSCSPSNRIVALAVTTATRQEVLPDIPTVGEFVPGYEASAWQGLLLSPHADAGVGHGELKPT